jgi:D-alanine-D-alanine ligase
MKEKTIGVLMGGMSSEREISIASGKAVARGLRKNGWKVVEIDVGPDLPGQLLSNGIGIGWIALHGRFGEDGCVQGLLEVMRIPYTGSGVQACAISMDKIATKRALAGQGVRLPADTVLRRGEAAGEVTLPVVVKDPSGGSSIGVWICRTEGELKNALGQCESEEILLEEYVEGEEITVAVLDGEALPVVAIRPKGDFFNLEAKYTKGETDYFVPAPISDEIALDAQLQAVESYRNLKMGGIARADFIVPKDGKPRFLEINACPGMTETSLSPMAANAVGITFEDLVERILMTAKYSPV